MLVILTRNKIHVSTINMNIKTRTYDSSKRKAQAEARRTLMLKCGTDEFRLEDVAQAAGVSGQTILRAFGSKDGLVIKTLEFEAPSALDMSVYDNIRIEAVGDMIRTMFQVYDKIGDLVIHALAHEHRSPEFQKSLDVGRAFHKGWIADACDIHIAKRPPDERAAMFHALLAATDIYVWKILRRDEGLSLEEAVATVSFTTKSLIQENSS